MLHIRSSADADFNQTLLHPRHPLCPVLNVQEVHADPIRTHSVILVEKILIRTEGRSHQHSRGFQGPGCPASQLNTDHACLSCWFVPQIDVLASFATRDGSPIRTAFQVFRISYHGGYQEPQFLDKQKKNQLPQVSPLTSMALWLLEGNVPRCDRNGKMCRRHGLRRASRQIRGTLARLAVPRYCGV